LGRAAA